ncbi:MAG: hypothetical protein Q7U47_00205 [Paludibacter sp.]|nr:hypothetical protein [Paludibacter sp.]
MTVYLDNNILVSIEDRGLDFNKIKKQFPLNVQFVYSYVHVQELLESKIDFVTLKEKRINTLIETTDYNYIFSNGATTEVTQNHPGNVINDIKRHSSIFNSFRHYASNISIDRNKFMVELGIDKNRINNYNAQEVIGHINSLLKYSEEGFDFEYIVDLAGRSRHDKINTIFNFLDIVGYWRDSQTDKSDLARMYDAGHTFFASGCDYFISEDKRARNKAKVAYEFCNIKTKVLSLEELFSLPVLT